MQREHLTRRLPLQEKYVAKPIKPGFQPAWEKGDSEEILWTSKYTIYILSMTAYSEEPVSSRESHNTDCACWLRF